MDRKKAIVTKKESKDGVALCTNPNAQFRASSHTLTKGGKDAIDMYQAPGGVKKISNSVVSGRSVGAMSYDPQVLFYPAFVHDFFCFRAASCSIRAPLLLCRHVVARLQPEAATRPPIGQLTRGHICNPQKSLLRVVGHCATPDYFFFVLDHL